MKILDSDIYSKPITGKELRKLGEIVLVWKDEDDEIDEIPIKEPIDVADGIHLLSRYKDQVITVEPIIELTDQHVAVARLRFRRCTKTPGDEWP
jgi:hypothetical protein